LYPLLIASSKQLRINLILKGYLNGIPLQDAYKLLSFKDKFSLFGLLHLVIPYQFEKKKNLKKSHLSEPRKKKITKKSQLLILNQIEKFISNLKGPNITQSTWSNYDKENFYSPEDIREKKKIIKKVVNKVKPSLAIDIGCNIGTYSKVVIQSGCKYAIGYDFDHNAIDRASSKISNNIFLPLFMDATNPTVNSGWFQKERKGLIERSKDINFLMALAISHHLIIGKNISIESFCRWITRLAPYGIVEFIPKEDPAIIQLLKFREDIFYDYSKTNFEKNLSKYCKIIQRHTLPKSTRILYEFKTK
jgi:predicted RNA methylase